jgi:acetate kinase
MKPANPRILTINGGSSSLKFALFQQADLSAQRVSGRIDRIGLDNALFVVDRAGGARAEERRVDVPDQKVAVRLLIEWLERSVGFTEITAVGHRVVHGGNHYYQTECITCKMMADLHKISLFDPDHMPGEIEIIEAFQKRDPSLPQVACFDTAFHHDMPRVAQIVLIPRRFEATGVRRYGFHGLSYSYLMEELAHVASPEEASGRVILAHLGNGASLAAVKAGHSIDTTMGFTPASGLVMGTRTGDLDPGLVRFLSQTAEMTPDRFDSLVNHKSGRLGVSEFSSDVRDLLGRQSVDVRAAEAIELFCSQAKKWIGAFVAALGGLDTLVFAGGIGENAPEIRRRICEGLGFLGIALNESRNANSSLLISTDRSPVKIRVIRTDEEVMIARSVSRVLNLGSSSDLSRERQHVEVAS